MNLKTLFPKASASFLKANETALTGIAPQMQIADALHAVVALQQKRLVMNATERSYSLLLEAQRNAGEIVSWRYESVKLRLGDGCWFIPDFFIERAHLKPLVIEVKGFLREDARVKFIAAKEIHRWADFEMVQKKGASWTRLL